MAEENVIGAIQKEKATSKKDLPQVLVVTLNAFSVVYAAGAGVLSVYLGIRALITGGAIGGALAIFPFWFGISALVFGLLALITMKKITDRAALKKAFGVASIVLIIGAIMATTVAVAVMIYALMAVGAGGLVQKALWLEMFLPALGAVAFAVGLLFVVKKIYDGEIKLLPIINYVILGAAGIGIILSMIATLVGLYGKSSSYSPSYDYDFDYDYYLNY